MSIYFEPKEIFRHFIDQKDFMEDRIKNGIEMYRKGFMRLVFRDKSGNPLTGAHVKVNQFTHDFGFGGILFHHNTYASPEENRMHEEAHANLFNLGVVGLYWGLFEREKNNPRFTGAPLKVGNSYMATPEENIAYAKKYNITLKGHPLFWGIVLPEWGLPQNYEQLRQLITKRFREIAEKLDGILKWVDVINETTFLPVYSEAPDIKKHGFNRNQVPMGMDIVDFCFKQADRYFADTRLTINEGTQIWNSRLRENSAYYMQIRGLINRNIRIDDIGMQFHMFVQPDELYNAADWAFNPKRLYEILDTYAVLGRPMHISEVTVPSYGENGDEIQAEGLRNLYRIWFSHKDVRSIIYWYFNDNRVKNDDSIGWNETIFRPGLIRKDFSEKPAYKVLDELINKEWRTNLELDVKDDHADIKGFFGRYEITVLYNGKETKREIDFSKSGFDEFVLTLE